MTTHCSLNYKFDTWKFQAQTWGEHVVYRNCFWHSEQFLYTKCSPHVLKKEELLTKIYLYVPTLCPWLMRLSSSMVNTKTRFCVIFNCSFFFKITSNQSIYCNNQNDNYLALVLIINPIWHELSRVSIIPIDLNFHLPKCFEIFDKNSADKIQS